MNKPNQPVDKTNGVSLHHLLLRSSQELSSANPEPAAKVHKHTSFSPYT